MATQHTSTINIDEQLAERRERAKTRKRERIQDGNGEFFGVDELETKSGLSRWTWRRWAYAGKVTSVKVGKRLLIPGSEYERLMREGTRPALPPAA
jgi:hypothetical protein